MKYRRPNGTIGFSDLKLFSESPAHYKQHMTTPFEPTRPMRIGTIVDRIVFKQPLPPIWEGRRQGKAWDKFKSENDNIVTQAEVDEAKPIARAVLDNPLAMEYLTGQYQVPLTWEMNGIQCGTGGIDCLNINSNRLVDLKTSKTSKPEPFMWHAFKMHYDAQLAFYQEGAKLNGIDTSGGLFIVGVSSKPPHLCTVLELSPRVIEEGKAKIYAWLEMLKNCEDSDQYPGYIQSVVRMGSRDELDLVGLLEEEQDE